MPTAGPPVVLVIEDNPETNLALVRLLKLERYRAVAAFDGLDALTQLRGGLRPSVIIADIVMPNMDGPRFIKELAADPALNDIPIVVYSAVASAVPREGVAAFVPKARDPDVLLDVVAGLCRPRKRR